MSVEKMSTEQSAVSQDETPMGSPADPGAAGVTRPPGDAPVNAVEIVELHKTYRGGNGQAV